MAGMAMKREGIVADGPYKGQRYFVAGKGMFPGWTVVALVDEENRRAYREVPTRFLEEE